MRRLSSQRGFTLVEMIIVIVITGIIAGMVAMFIRAPVQGYVDSERRAAMTDIADTALRRMGRDLRTAVPNSVRILNPLDSTYVEFLPTKDGGRYRVDRANGTGGCAGVLNNTLGDALNFDDADTCFEIVGPGIIFAAGDAIVIGSTQSSGDAAYRKTTALVGGVWVGGVLRDAANGPNAQTVVMAGAQRFPAAAELEAHRFAVVPGNEKAVTYACLNMQGGALDAKGDGQGTLTRYWNYGFNVSLQPPGAGTAAVLADKVSACHFTYDTSNQTNSLLAVRLTITRGGESVELFQEIHINNIP